MLSHIPVLQYKQCLLKASTEGITHISKTTTFYVTKWERHSSQSCSVCLLALWHVFSQKCNSTCWVPCVERNIWSYINDLIKLVSLQETRKELRLTHQCFAQLTLSWPLSWFWKHSRELFHGTFFCKKLLVPFHLWKFLSGISLGCTYWSTCK